MKKQNITTFEQAVDYLYQVPRFTAKHTPEATQQFLRKLGSPDKEMHIIHVAGTNGKGSVCSYLRCMLEASGRSVAVFISPHLVDIRERFIVRGEMIGRETFLEAFQEIYEALDWETLEKEEGYHPTFFEYLFLMAMLIFRRAGVDYVILETGLGGRLDATNTVSGKDLAVVTRISRDHVEYLGDTIGQIAGEKAGILHPSAPVVYADVEPEATRVLEARAKELGIKSYPVSKNDYANFIFKNKNIDFSLQCRYYGYVKLTLHTIAAYQIENAALAVRAIEVLDGGRMSLEQIRTGLENSFWPGRMEEVLPEVYLDGAHNEDGIRAFLDTVKNDKKDGRRKLLFGVVADKEYDLMLKELIESGMFGHIGIARLESGRAASLESIDKIMKKYPGCAYTLYESVETALRELLAAKTGEERLYIAGSLYLAGEVKGLLPRVTDWEAE